MRHCGRKIIYANDGNSIAQKLKEMNIKSHQLHFWICIALIGLLQYCAPTKPASTPVVQYDEDISYLREKIKLSEDTSQVENFAALDLSPKHDLRFEMDSVLKIIQEDRKDVKFLNGYTVQIYSGNSRELANEARNKVYDTFDQFDPEITYSQPNFKINVGRFFDRLEANRVYNVLKVEFPNALVLPERIFFSQKQND